MPPIEVPAPGRPCGSGRSAGQRRRQRRPSVRESRPATFPSIPGLNMTDVGPDRNDPFPNRSFADIVTAVDEAPTGRFMVGVAASSFQGLFGNVTVYEKNFDIFNVPRSFNDVFNGTAFRGGGQEFRLDLQPGTNINRFQVSLREPYLFDLPIGAGVAGYWFSRFYPDWDERRGGGRFSLGRQFGTSIYADVAFRIEDINFYGFRTPAPAEYLAASGRIDPALAPAQPSVRQPQQPVHGHQGPVRRVLLRARLGHVHLVEVRRRGPGLLHHRQPARRHRQAVLHAPRPLRHRHPRDPRLRAVFRR